MSDDDRAKSRDTIVAAMVGAIEARFPARFDGDQIEQIRKQVDQLVDAANKLRGYPLSNADEPEPIVRAYREGM